MIRLPRIIAVAFVLAGCSTPAPSVEPVPSEGAAEGAPDPGDEGSEAPTQAPIQIHLSFDDAPGPGLRDVEEGNARNAKILAVLGEHSIEASVFYNCDKLLPGDNTIEAWEQAGMVVGNHTHSHANLGEVGVEAWMEDVTRCDTILRERLSAAPTWFRYPYLCEGADAASRDAAKQGLTDMGYANAHVTAATSEWLLAGAYRTVKQGEDRELEQSIVDAYREHMVASVEAGRELARHELERETTQVVLFHVNELAADHLDEVLDDYEAKGYVFVSLEQALADEVFTLPNHFESCSGISWLARIHEPGVPRPPYWFGQEEGRLQELFGHLLAD